MTYTHYSNEGLSIKQKVKKQGENGDSTELEEEKEILSIKNKDGKGEINFVKDGDKGTGKITGIKDGEISESSTETITGKQLNDLGSKLGLEVEINKTEFTITNIQSIKRWKRYRWNRKNI